MRAAIIPSTKRAFFDKPVSEDKPYIRMSPVKIYSGPFKNKYAVNEEILNSCPEWREVADALRQAWEDNGITIEEVDPNDLRDSRGPVI